MTAPAPTAEGWTLTDIHRLYGDGVFARLEHPEAGSLLLSRLDGETAWTADGSFTPGGFPRWCHGFGFRCTALRTVAQDSLVALLDQAARELKDQS